jgi:putative DNA primase/helicase
MAQDSFSFWIEDCCERDSNTWTRTTDLFALWKAWAEKAGVRYGDIKSFGETLEGNGFAWKHTKHGNGHQGLRILSEPPEPHWSERNDQDCADQDRR